MADGHITVTVNARADEVQAMADEIERLRAALADAIEEVECWAAYASDYFQEKHDLAGTLERLRAALEKP